MNIAKCLVLPAGRQWTCRTVFRSSLPVVSRIGPIGRKAVKLLVVSTIGRLATGVSDSFPIFVADRVEDWVQEQSYAYDGLLVKRSNFKDWSHIQEHVDRAFVNGEFGQERSVTLARVENSNDADVLRGRFKCAAAVAATKLAAIGLPNDINQQIASDFCELGPVAGLLCPDGSDVKVSLNVMAEDVCKRWHRDYYMGRGIVSYTGVTGTMHTSYSNVDEWELENCGNNDCVIKDKQHIKSVDVGDMLFIKGRHFPRLRKGSKGLIHKSAELKYLDDGTLLNRLVLKVDVKG